MSFLSDQQPGLIFLTIASKELYLSPTEPAQTWDWQPTPSLKIRTTSSLMVGSGALATTGRTDEDKLCFFEQPSMGKSEIRVPGKVGA